MACASLFAVACTTSTSGDILVDWDPGTDCPEDSAAVVTVQDVTDPLDIFTDVVVFNCNEGAGVVTDLLTPGDFDIDVEIYSNEGLVLNPDGVNADGAFYFGASDVEPFIAFDLDAFLVPVAFEYAAFGVPWTIDGLDPDATLCDEADIDGGYGDVTITTDLYLDAGGNSVLTAEWDFDCTDGAGTPETGSLELGIYDISLEAFFIDDGTSAGLAVLPNEANATVLSEELTLADNLTVVDLIDGAGDPEFDFQPL